MSNVTYQQVRDWAEQNGVSQHPSEVHGLIAGWLSAGSKWDSTDRRQSLSDFLSLDLSSSAASVLEDLYKVTAEGLGDAELGFEMLLPDDDSGVNTRTSAVSFWCSGFLAGFGMTGRYQDGELSEDVKEVMKDLSRVASFAGEVPDSDENEADLLQIGEYVRMSAVLVYTECAEDSHH